MKEKGVMDSIPKEIRGRKTMYDWESLKPGEYILAKKGYPQATSIRNSAKERGYNVCVRTLLTKRGKEVRVYLLGKTTTAHGKTFSSDITDSKSFIKMPTTAQALYFHLGARANNNGITTSPKSIIKRIGASHKDLEILLEKGFAKSTISGINIVTEQ